jgi:hypothetical protein
MATKPREPQARQTNLQNRGELYRSTRLPLAEALEETATLSLDVTSLWFSQVWLKIVAPQSHANMAARSVW